MSELFEEFNQESISDLLENDSPHNDESIESENNFITNILSDQLIDDNYKISELNEKSYLSFLSYSYNYSSLYKEYNLLKEAEQINEVKYNLFMILNKNCSYHDEYNNIFSISQQDRKIKLRRLVIQRMNISADNKVIYEKKNYIFFPFNKNNTIQFNYKIGTNKQFEINIDIKEGIIKCDGNILIKEEIFKDYPKLQENLKKEKEQNLKEYNERSYPRQNGNENENKNNADENQKLININNTKDDTKNKIDEENNDDKGNKRERSLTNDESENEVKQKSTFYLEKEKNIFYRFCFCTWYKKEIDGIYNFNNKIDLNIDKEVNFESSIGNLETLKNNYNINNDLKSHIIYKNFESSKIKENTPMFVEVKKGFDLFSLLNQIKQSAKILKYMNLEDNNIKLPKLIIGIICNFNEKQANCRYNRLKTEEKGKEILKHFLDIIKETKMDVVIGAIKDGKINNYDLNKDDCDITLDSGEKTNKRIDLAFLNRLALNNRYSEKDINYFTTKLEDRYKSIKYEKRFVFNNSQLSSYSNEEMEKLKQKLKEVEEAKKKEGDELRIILLV